MVDDATQASIDRLIARLRAANDPDVTALIGRYEAGKLALAALVSQAHDILAQNADDALDDIAPGQRANHHVLLCGLGFATLGALAILANTPDSVPDVAETSSMFALQAAAAEYGGAVKPAVVAEARRNLDGRIQGVADALAGGDITGPQAAAYVETIVYNDAWLTYGTEQNQQAQDAGETHGWWETDAPKGGSCEDCTARENNSPYPIDELPGIPGDGSTSCGPGCLCSVRYGKAEKATRRDVYCPHCAVLGRQRWIGRGIPNGAEAYCPVHKGVTVGGQP